jgi:hypothetical protein
VQRPHELRDEPLPEGMQHDQFPQLADEPGQTAAHREGGLDAGLQRVETPLGEPGRVRGHQRRRRDVGERRPSPQCECVVEHLPGRRRIGSRTQQRLALGQQVVEPVGVEITPPAAEPISPRLGGQHRRVPVADRAAQRQHVPPDEGLGRTGRLVRPQLLDQVPDRHGPVRVDQQHGEQPADLRPLDRTPAGPHRNLKRTEVTKTHDVASPMAMSSPRV